MGVLNQKAKCNPDYCKSNNPIAMRGYPLAKAKIGGFWGVFLSPMTGLVVTVLTTTICVLIFIGGIGYANTNDRLTLLSAAVSKEETVSQSVLNKSEIEAAPKKRMPNGTANKAMEGSEQADEWQTVRMRVTAYCPCAKCCGRYSDGKTANGHKIHPGDAFLAADKKYAFGTEMIVAGYKNEEPVKVLDRGGAIRGNRLDVFFHCHEEALKWGVRYIDVKVRCK